MAITRKQRQFNNSVITPKWSVMKLILVRLQTLELETTSTLGHIKKLFSILFLLSIYLTVYPNSYMSINLSGLLSILTLVPTISCFTKNCKLAKIIQEEKGNKHPSWIYKTIHGERVSNPITYNPHPKTISYTQSNFLSICKCNNEEWKSFRN